MEESKKTNNYWPLFALLIVTALAATALNYGVEERFERGVLSWMHFFMGFFFCIFALLKLFHPSDFADGFQMYDILAKRSRFYAYLYPLIELGLGLAYLSFIIPILIYLLTILVMGVGAIGVIQSLRKKLDITCACMGTVLDVPLSTVTLTEDLGMGLMALFMLFFSL